ncbi:MAG: hypothetical protein GYB33_02635 [Gammaproteobacteria bacterium]|nr:hypothetical protein [Gammaproteobacteria bacterium]
MYSQSGIAGSTGRANWYATDWEGKRHWSIARLFLVVLCVSLLLSLAFTYLRAPVYRSTATLLIAPPPTFSDGSQEFNQQYVAVQSQLLTNRQLLESTWQVLQSNSFPDLFPDLSQPQIQQMLQVELLPQNIVLLHVTGTDKMAVQPIASTWLANYIEMQGTGIDDTQQETLSTLEQENRNLIAHLNSKRSEIEAFAQQHKITSSVREENETLSQLSGLSARLAQASGEVVQARARLQSLQESELRGELAAEGDIARELAAMKSQAAKLKGKLDRLRQRYTAAYMAKEPTMAAMQDEYQLLQSSIGAVLKEAHQEALQIAARELSQAQALQRGLQEQLSQSDQKIREFTENFLKYEEMRRELQRLEEMVHAAGEKLVAETVGNRNRAPRITVLDPPQVPEQPIYPHYGRDAMISVAGSLLLALVCSWLYLGYLRNRIWIMPATADSVRVNSLQLAAQARQGLPGATGGHLLEDRSVYEANQLPSAQPQPQILQPGHIDALLQVAVPSTRILIALLVSGVRPQELPQLSIQDFDAESRSLKIAGRQQRLLTVSETVATMLQAFSQGNPDGGCIWQDGEGQRLSVDELEAMLRCAAIDAGLAQGHSIGLADLHFTYLTYLVGQGLRLGELGAIAGTLDSATLQFLSHFVPSGGGLALAQINPHYPLPAAVASRSVAHNSEQS